MKPLTTTRTVTRDYDYGTLKDISVDKLAVEKGTKKSKSTNHITYTGDNNC